MRLNNLSGLANLSKILKARGSEDWFTIKYFNNKPTLLANKFPTRLGTKLKLLSKSYNIKNSKYLNKN